MPKKARRKGKAAKPKRKPATATATAAAPAESAAAFAATVVASVEVATKQTAAAAAAATTAAAAAASTATAATAVLVPVPVTTAAAAAAVSTAATVSSSTAAATTATVATAATAKPAAMPIATAAPAVVTGVDSKSDRLVLPRADGSGDALVLFPPAGASVRAFRETTDPATGRTYWYNNSTKYTTWRDPYAPGGLEYEAVLAAQRAIETMRRSSVSSSASISGDSKPTAPAAVAAATTAVASVDDNFMCEVSWVLGSPVSVRDGTAVRYTPLGISLDIDTHLSFPRKFLKIHPQDTSDRWLLAVQAHHHIREVDLKQNSVELFAGRRRINDELWRRDRLSTPYLSDLCAPWGMAVDPTSDVKSPVLYVTEYGGNRILKIAANRVSTVVDYEFECLHPHESVPRKPQGLYGPTAILVSSDGGCCYVMDSNHYIIRRVELKKTRDSSYNHLPVGTVTTVCGTGYPFPRDGDALKQASFSSSSFLCWKDEFITVPVTVTDAPAGAGAGAAAAAAAARKRIDITRVMYIGSDDSIRRLVLPMSQQFIVEVQWRAIGLAAACRTDYDRSDPDASALAGYAVPYDLWWVVASYLTDPVSYVDTLQHVPAPEPFDPLFDAVGYLGNKEPLIPWPRGITDTPSGLLLVSSERCRLHVVDPSVHSPAIDPHRTIALVVRPKIGTTGCSWKRLKCQPRASALAAHTVMETCNSAKMGGTAPVVLNSAPVGMGMFPGGWYDLALDVDRRCVYVSELQRSVLRVSLPDYLFVPPSPFGVPLAGLRHPHPFDCKCTACLQPLS